MSGWEASSAPVTAPSLIWLDAFTAAFERAVPDAAEFETRYKGRLAGLAAQAPDKLYQAIADFEVLEDGLGRLISYSGLMYAGDSSNALQLF